MTQLTLWQKLKFIEELMIQISNLQTELDEFEEIIEQSKHQKKHDLLDFENKIREDLKKQKKRELFLDELLARQNQDKESYNHIVVQINSVIDNRLSNPQEYTKLNVDPSNPKEIELIKKTLRQKLLAKV